MLLNPRFFEMGAKTWRDPLTHQKWVEEEKLRLAAAKKKAAEEKLAKEVESASSKLAQKKIVEKGRLVDEQKKDEYLAQLKADVARLEAKQAGKVQDPLKDILEYDKDRVVKQAEEREKELDKEVKLTAAEMLKLREKELEEQKKQQEKELADLADRRRRELLEYKHALGLSHDHPRPPQRPPLTSRRPLSLHDDPEFWKLDDADRHRLELMHPDERVQYGFGPYEEDEIERELALRGGVDSLTPAQPHSALAERQLAQKMKDFVCIAGVTKTFEPISHAVPLDLPDLATLPPQDQQQAELIIQQEAQLLQDDLVRFAIEQHGANALLGLRIDGPLPVEDPALLQEGYVYEVRAEGVPALVAKAKPPLRSRYGGRPAQSKKADGPTSRGQYSHFGGTAGVHFDSPLFGLEDDFLAGLGHEAYGAGGGYAGGVGGTAAAGRGAAASGWKRPAAGWGGGASLFGRGDDFARFDDPLARQSRYPPTAAQPVVPSHLKNLPWAAQQYVKRMRALQEQEEAEALAQAAAAPRLPHLSTPHHQQSTLPLPRAPQPPMFGASPALRPPAAANLTHTHADPTAHPPPTQGAQTAQPAEPARPDAVGGGVFRLAGGLLDRLRGKEAAPQATTDPDHGAGGPLLGQGGLAASAAPQAQPLPQAQPQRVVPSKENGWRGAQPW
uniref:Uncharacterized protein n=1 Tax=Rhodotorula toruloides TaxID=5286 RepID=A0A0K3CB28_RHOTO